MTAIPIKEICAMLLNRICRLDTFASPIYVIELSNGQTARGTVTFSAASKQVTIQFALEDR